MDSTAMVFVAKFFRLHLYPLGYRAKGEDRKKLMSGL